jgi:hypothetical protein
MVSNVLSARDDLLENAELETKIVSLFKRDPIRGVAPRNGLEFLARILIAEDCLIPIGAIELRATGNECHAERRDALRFLPGGV